jgi:hypothetical protein
MAAQSAQGFRDLKTFGKVVNFNGNVADWALRSFKFKGWLAFIPDVGGRSVSDGLDRATSMNDEGQNFLRSRGEAYRP